MSSRNGSSIRGSFCAARKMRLLGVARACSSARTELSRPTMKGAIIWGKTTMSRRGTRGRFSRFLLMNGEAILLSLRALACVPRRPPASAGFLVQHDRLHAACHDLFVDHALLDVALRGDVVHQVQHQLLEDDAQAAGRDGPPTPFTGQPG